jgi:Tol biopolymer transport system component
LTLGRAARLVLLCSIVSVLGGARWDDVSAGASGGRNGRIFFTKGGDLYSIDPSGRNLRRITRTRAPEEDPSAAPGGAELVFRTANDEIARIRSSGAGRVNLTRNGAHDFAPDWGSSGRIAFTSSRVGGQTIWTIDRSGGWPRQVSPADGEYPAWSGDGRWIAFSRPSGATYDLWVMRANGAGLRQLTDTITIWEGTPSWSPDNRTIVFSRGDPNGGLGGRKLWVVDRGGGGLRQLTSGRGNDDFAPSWSPDRTRIAFTRNNVLFTIDAGGARPRSLRVPASLPDWASAPS